MGGEYLVWEENENFCVFRDFRGFSGIGLAFQQINFQQHDN